MENRKRLLMLFLQEVIPEHRIASLTYAPQEHENPHPQMKGIRVDVECTGEVLLCPPQYGKLPDPPEGFEGELFRLLFETAEIATFTPQEKIKLENDMRTERDLRNQMAYAYEKGRDDVVSILREKGYPEEVIEDLLRELEKKSK